MFFSAPPPANETINILYIVVPSAVSLFVGLMTGGVASYTGLRRLKIDAEAHKNDTEAQKISTSNMLINDALMLVNSMRDEVKHKTEENTRLLTENQDLKSALQKYQEQADLDLDQDPATKAAAETAAAAEGALKS